MSRTRVHDGAPSPGPEPVDARLVRHGGRLLLAFTGSDYLRRTWTPGMRAQLARAVLRHGPDAAASRVTTGNLGVYAAAERALAGFAGLPEAVLTSSGYTAPLVAAQALAPSVDRVWIPERCHPCLHDAARIAGLPAEVVSPARIPRAGGRRVALFLDGLGALDGRIPPLRDWLARLPAGGRVLLDDAHGVGTLGRRGRGLLEHLGVDDPRVVLAFTLSKAFGLAGGVVAGPRGIAGAVWTHSTLQRASTPVPPAYAAVVPAAAAWMARHGTRARARVAALAARLAHRLGGAGDDHVGPVFLVVPGHPAATARIRDALLDAGIFPSFIRYPGVPGDGAFRLALGVAHTVRDVDALGTVLSRTRSDDATAWHLA